MGEGIGGVWKSLALVCVTILIAGAPAIIYAIRTWNIQDDVHLIRERQDDVRIRLGVLEERNAALEEQVRELHAELLTHVQQEGMKK